MFKMKKTFLLLFTICIALAGSFNFAKENIDVGIDEQLGQYLPLDLSFVDENGKSYTIRELLKKPTVLAFVYYECPGICSPLMMELADIVNKTDLVIGVDYNVVTISMDQFETPENALKRKEVFIKVIDKNIPPDGWKFLTGDSLSIKTVTDKAGFYFKRQGKDFLHSGAFIFINTDGKICRYLFPSFSERSGFGILPFDFKMAVLETSEGKVIPTVAKVLQFCFTYDPSGKTYVLNLTRIFGIIILVAIGIFLFFVVFKRKKVIINTR